MRLVTQQNRSPGERSETRGHVGCINPDVATRLGKYSEQPPPRRTSFLRDAYGHRDGIFHAPEAATTNAFLRRSRLIEYLPSLYAHPGYGAEYGGTLRLTQPSPAGLIR